MPHDINQRGEDFESVQDGPSGHFDIHTNGKKSILRKSGENPTPHVKSKLYLFVLNYIYPFLG